MSAQPENGRFERTAPYLRPHQVSELIGEQKAIEESLRAPAHISGQITDRSSMVRQVRHIQRALHEDSPKPYAEHEIDRAVRREQELREKWTTGMPTQAEMRRAPAGAIDKHRSWERKNKRDILEWKNIRQRLHASGMIDDHPDAREVSNIEQYRPEHSVTEVPMHNPLVPGKWIFLPDGHITVKNVMSEDDRAGMAQRDLEAAAAAEAALAAMKPGKNPTKG